MDIEKSVAVRSLAQAKRVKRNYDAIITIEDPSFRKGLRFHNAPHPDQLVMWFEDVDHPWETVALPNRVHVETALDFAREHVDGSILVHCKAGVARSTAIALAIIADRLGAGNEDEAVNALMTIRSESIPNVILLDIVDEVLNREGRLKEAWMKIENGSRAYAENREAKVETFRKFPSLYAPPPADPTFGIWRYRPHSLTKERVFDSFALQLA